MNQLTMNKNNYVTNPCRRTTAFALVPEGITHQSIKPNTADGNPPMIPAAIIQNKIATGVVCAG
jgi:hypothetical protein